VQDKKRPSQLFRDVRMPPVVTFVTVENTQIYLAVSLVTNILDVSGELAYTWTT
jgi:hypothetical protein